MRHSYSTGGRFLKKQLRLVMLQIYASQAG